MLDGVFRWLVYMEGYLVFLLDLLLTFSLLWLACRMLDRLASRLFLRGDRHSHPAARLLAALVFGLSGLASITPALINQVALAPLALARPGARDWYMRSLAVLPCIWLGGILFHLARYWHRRARLMQSLMALPDPPADDPALAEAVKNSGAACTPQCKCADTAGTIALCGLRNPVLVVSHTFFRRYSHEERYVMYLHECVHIRRRDTVRFLLCDLWEIVFWMLPPLRAEAQYVRECCEIACDSRVLRTGGAAPRVYRRLLAQQAAPAHRYQVGFSSGGFRELKARIGATGQEIPHKTLRVVSCCCVVLLAALLFCQHPQSRYLGEDWYWGLKIVLGDQREDVLLIPADPAQEYSRSEDVLVIPPEAVEDPENLLALVSGNYPGETVQKISLCWVSFYWNGVLSGHTFGDGRLICEAAVFFPQKD